MKFEDFKPMLASPVDMDKLDRYANYTMEVKLDGVRCIAIKDPEGHINLYTRSGKELTHKLPHIADQLRHLRGHFVLDGEIGYTQYNVQELAGVPYGIDFNATMRVVGSEVDQAITKQCQNTNEGSKPIKFIVFDILQKGNYPTYRMSQRDRRSALLDLFDNLRIAPIYDIELSHSWPAFDNDLYTTIVNLGGEGVMLKNPEATYQIGKRRVGTWYKVKAFDTIDCEIVAWEKGQGKYEAQVGALVVVDPTGTEIRISGMTDAQRLDMTVYFVEKYLKRMCEVRYFGKVGKEAEGYRHPQFVRMRYDLD